VGDSLGGLTPIVRHYGYTDGYKLTFPVEAGRSYQIVSDALNSNFVGLTGFNLRFTKANMPAPIVGSDAFANRTNLTLTVGSALAVANNEQATVEPGEPDHLSGQRNFNTVWWKWTAPVSGTVAIDTLGLTGLTGAAGQTCLVIYTGDSLDSLTHVTTGNGNMDGYKLTFPVAAGRTYQIVSDAPNGNYIGQVGFNLHFHSLYAPAVHPAAHRPQTKPKRKAAS
ncbi:MAG: hypothetical protein JO250_01990, partial [Armatimonadetes bacterium]|nr:hypothetical protein [Armatimonadota bacterium]